MLQSQLLVTIEVAVLAFVYMRHWDCICNRLFVYYYVIAQLASGFYTHSLLSVFYAKETTDNDKEEDDKPSRGRSQMRRHLSVFERVREAEVNPFINKWELSSTELLHLSVTGSILIPLRVPLFMASMCAASAVCKIATIALPKGMGVSEPLSPVRRALVWLVNPCFRIVLFSLGVLSLEQEGQAASSAEAPIVIANHITFMDSVPLIAQLLPSPIAAYENLKQPLIGNIIRALCTVTVDRTDKQSRVNTMTALKTRGKSNGKWPHILIFPEGTTHSDNSLVTFKMGAFIPGVPVQPVVIKYGPFNPSWVAGGPTIAHLLVRYMATPSSTMTIKYMPVYRPSPEEQKDAKLYANNVRAYMASAMGNVPTTAHSFEDIVLSRKAEKLHLPVVDTVIEAPRLMAEFKVDVNFLKEQMERFAKFDTENKGFITFSQFCETLSIPDTPFSRHYFSLMDTDEDGHLDFREFLLGLGMLNTPTMDNSALAKTAFTILDTTAVGKVKLQDTSTVLIKITPPEGLEVDGEPVEMFDCTTLKKLMGLKEDEDVVTLEQWQNMMATYPTIMPEYIKQVFGA